jgi:hypothetical protein
MSATTYTCRSCDRSAPWTDGQSREAGDPVDEFWCQTCGEEQPLPAPDPAPVDWPARSRAAEGVATDVGVVLVKDCDACGEQLLTYSPEVLRHQECDR